MRTRQRGFRRIVNAVATMALGTGMLAGATAISVLSTSSPAAAKTQTANCTFASTGHSALSNQLQGSPTVLVPFMLNGGAVITPGTTQFTINCTGLAPSLGLLIGIASPLAGFNSTATPATFALNEFMGSVDATGPDEPTATPAGTLVNYVYTVPTSGAADTDAVCPPTAAQVAMGLPNCAMAVADGAGNEYGFGYVNYAAQPPWPASTVVPTSLTEFGLTNPPNLLVSPATVSAGGTVTLSSLPAPYCLGASLPATCGQFWADPDGTLTEPLTVEVYDSAGTINALTANTQSPEAIGIDVYQPNGYGFNIHGGGTLTGGVLTGLTETIPTGGLADMGAGGATAFVPGALHFVVVEPSVAPYNDTTTAAAYDTVTNACTATGTVTGLTSTSCPIPGAPNADPSPVGAIGTGQNALLPAPLAITTTSLANATALSAYSASVTATGGYTPYTWSSTGLPAWATLNASTGAITGTPGAGDVGTTTFTATVTDSATPTPTVVSKSLSIQVLSAFAITTTSLPTGTPGDAYSTTLTGQGGTTPYTWSATGLPAWATLNASTGAITGTAAAGTSSVTVTLTDSSSPIKTTSATFSLVVAIVAPGAPTGLQIVAGNGSLALSWTAPANNGGSAITSYTVTCTPTTGPVVTDTVTGTPPATSVPALTVVNGMSYSCTVTATNAVGTSGASNVATASANSTQCTVSGYYRTALGVNVGTAGGNCLTIETLSVPVTGSNISITDASQSVTLSGVTLGGEFQNSTGNLQTVNVNDSRGTLTGWTVTGQMEGDFTNLYPTGNVPDNWIPADFLTWAPWVGLSTPGNIPADNTNTIFCPGTGCVGPSGLAAAAGTPTVVVGGTLPAGLNGTGAGTGGVSSTPAEVYYGPTAVLNNYNTGGQAKVLCEAPTGGGGGEFTCGAYLSLAVPPYVAAGTYTATMDIIVTGL